MKKRLSGVTSAIFYDVVLTSKQLLCDKSGTKESMVGRVIDRCLDDSANFQMQDKETQKLWQWSPSNESATWKMALDLLDSVKDD
eukprot:scaffold37941_cov139-Skeletonema_dohrnii-CCMP3373.AAC.1